MPTSNETLKFTVNFKGTNRASSETTIVDKSYPITYASKWSSRSDGGDTITRTNEGTTVYLVVNTWNVPDGTPLTCELSGSNVTGTDVTIGSLSQTANVSGNYAYFPWTFTNDQVTEGNETLTATVRNGSTNVSTSILIINDTSLTPNPTYNTFWSTTADGNNPVSKIDEGKKVYFCIRTTNLANGSVLVFHLGAQPVPNSIDADDFVNYQYQRNVTINNNTAYVEIEVKADNKTEGEEYVQGVLMTAGGSVLSYAPLYINDTSITPEPTYIAGWYSSSAGTTAISQINEGSTAWLIVKTTNVPNGTVLSARILSNAGLDDFTEGSGYRDITINNNVGKISYSVLADLKTEGDEAVTVMIFNGEFSVARADLLINDTSRETVITVPYEYNGKSVIVSELVKKLLGRAPGSDERFRVVVPSNVNLLGFPEVVGRKYLRQEVVPNGGIVGGDGAKFFYEDTFWGPYAGLDLTTMPNSGLVTADVYGTVIGGPIQLYFGNDPRYLDNTVVFGNLGVDYMSYPNMLITANGASRVTNFYDDPPVNPRKVHNVAICGNNGFNLIVRDGAMVSGHGGAVTPALGAVQDYVYGDFIFDASGNIVGMTEGSSQYRKFNKEGRGGDALSNTTSGTIKYNVMGSGILTGGGGCGGAGGGLLAGNTTHEVPLSVYYAGLGGGGAPYGGALYRFDGWSGDPVCPAKYSRIGSFTAGRRLGDTGSTGYYSKFSAGSADLKTPGGCAGRYQYGNDRKGYGWDYEPNIGGAPGQDGGYGITYRYQDYRWSGNKIVVYTAEERAAASVPGKAGDVTYFSVITHDPSLT